MPAWDPTTEEELRSAAANGLLGESHHLDIKRELMAGRGVNAELARDLASFAIDGGLLLLGVDEDATPPTLYPIPLAGLPERVEQVGLTRIDEPLAVRTTPIPSAEDNTLGYLVVRVPPSPLAPHMVDGRYYGRGDKTRFVLSDDEVSRLHLRRRQWEQTAGELLDAYVRRDPTSLPGHGHLFIVAEPIAAPEGLLVPLVEGGPGHWHGNLLDLIQTRALAKTEVGGGFAPDLRGALAPSRRADGWALTSHDFQEDRSVAASARERQLLELEISEQGALRLFCGRGTDMINGQKVVLPGIVVGLCHRVLAIAKQLAEETGCWASWDFGVAMIGMRGSVPWLPPGTYLADTPTFPDEDYRQTARATREELASRPNAVADRLVGRLIRALGMRAQQELCALLD
jgi:hypothetical protein